MLRQILKRKEEKRSRNEIVNLRSVTKKLPLQETSLIGDA